GKTVYEKVCLSCHQADGSGVPNLTPPLIEGVFVNGEKKTLIGMVLAGMEEVNIKGEYYAGSMPGFDYLSDDEIADVLTFVRSSFKNKAQPISKAEVAAVRTAKKQQKPD
ncbi:MAG: cytochrome c, partial [Bacteroidota bacterium]|nr:cytochrome c [Bacteroidota bacterium]